LPKIRITRTTPVALDGVHVRLLQKDQELDVESDVAKMLVYDLRIASIIRERTMPEPSERAVVESAPEIKEEGTEEKSEETGEEDNPYIRVFQLAKDLGVSNRLILNKAKDLGIAATAPASNLSDEEVKRLKKALGIGNK